MMNKIKQLQFNDEAPDLQVILASGEKIQLSSLWAQTPLLLSFTRHFGCPQCKEMLDMLQDNKKAVEESGLRLAVVTQAELAEAKEYCAAKAPGTLCIADANKELYRLYGLYRGNIRQTFLSWSVMRANRRATRLKGYKPELPPKGQDSMLMSGVFIIGTDGRVRLPYYYDHIADHPTPQLLLKGIFATSWNDPLDSPLGGKA